MITATQKPSFDDITGKTFRTTKPTFPKPSFEQITGRVKETQFLPGTVQYPIPKEPQRLVAAKKPSGFLKKAKPLNWEDASPIEKFTYGLSESKTNYLLERFGKQLTNAFARVAETAISHPLSPVGIPQREAEQYKAQATKELQLSGFRGGPPQAEELIRSRAAQLAAAQRIPKFEVDPPTEISEKVTDVAAGLTAFIAQLALTKRLLPKGTPAPVIWEIQNEATGGIPGEGMAIRLALGGIGKIPTGSLPGKLGKIGLESGLFAGYTAAMGRDAEDIIIAGLIPVVFNAWGFAKQRHHITQYEKELRTQAIQKHRQRVKLGMRRAASQAYLTADMRVVDNAVAKAKQKIYHDDAFAPAKEKWNAQRQKALKMIASGKPEQVRVGNDILNWMEKRPAFPAKPIQQQIKEIRQTTKEPFIKFRKKIPQQKPAIMPPSVTGAPTPTGAIPAPPRAVAPITPEKAVEVAPEVEYVKPSTVDSMAQGSLAGAIEWKQRAWEKIKKLREQIKNEPIGGKKSQLRLELLKAEDSHREAIQLEKDAKKQIEKRAQELRQTTIKPSAKAEPAKVENWKQRLSDIIGHTAFREGVSESIQKDGQKVLDAAFKGDTETLEKMMVKYARDQMRDQGGVGAGPKKVKQARRGAVSVWQGAKFALEKIAPEKIEALKEAELTKVPIFKTVDEAANYRAERIASEIKPGEKSYVPPQFRMEVKGKSRLAPSSIYLKAAGLEHTKDLNYWRKPLKAEQVKPKGAPSKIGFPKYAPAIELPAEAIGKEPVSAREIIAHLSKALKVTYANMATHRPRMAAGWYEIKPIGIRQINVRDLGTAAHEAGHHIDHFWKVRRAGISKIGRRTWRMPEGTAKGTAAELTRLGKMLYGDRKPPGGYRSEGIAEFVRGYLTGHLDIKKEAPKFYKWFTEDYLPNNPEVAIGLKNARDMLTDYRLQGAEARIESQISTKEIKQAMADRIKAGNLWMQTMFIDEFAPLRAILEEKKLRVAGVEGLKQPLKPEEDPYELAVYYNQKEGARARAMVLFGTIDLWGNKTGKGLKEIMKPIADENAVRPFTHWVVSARALDLWKRGINPGISKADAQHVYDLYKDNVGWKETAQEITDWNGRVLDYLVQGGALESSVAKKMRELNPIYVPFLRAFAKGEKRFGGGGAGKGLITTKKGVFGIKGSGREIIDPFESMITQTRRMLSIAHKSVVAQSLANLEAKHRGLADFIWRVPVPKKATTFRSEQAIRQLQKMGVEVTGADADALMTVYGNSPIYLGKENIIAVVQNGKKNWYEVSPEMYRLLQGLDKFYLPRFLDVILGKPGRAVRLGATGINASFGLVRNPIRDSLDTIFKGTHARGPSASVQGVAKDLSRMGLAKSLGINPNKAAEEFVAQAGQISGFVGQDRKSLQHLKGEMLASSVGRYSIHTVKHPIDALRQVFGVAESGPRIQEYEKALIVGEKKYGKGSPSARIYAFNKAQDQTINYSRHGVIGKWLNQMIPFWNANAQDPSKVYRTFRTRGKEATAYAVAFLTLPALGLWWYNKDEDWYKELPAYETANYLHAKVPGKDVILRIPVPFLVGHIFQSTPVVMMDALYRADPERIKEHFKQVLKGDVYPLAEWPAIVSPIIDVLQNKDWAGRPIVPRGVEGKLPSDQYKEYTTEFCKTIGKIFNQSPAKIEYVINAYSGGLYRRTGRIAGIITKAPEERQPADWLVIGAIVVRDPYAPKRSIERFYKEKEQLNRMFQSDKIEPESDLDRKRKRYNYISTQFLSLYWKKLQKTKAVSERKKIYQNIGDLIKKAENNGKK